jgi:hypothetical protein
MDTYEALSARRTIRDFEQLNGKPRGLDPALRKITSKPVRSFLIALVELL